MRSQKLITRLLIVALVLLTAPTAAIAQESQPADSRPVRIHTVGPLDTLDVIAEQYGVPVDAIVRANGLTYPAAITTGQRLIIPQTSLPYSGESYAVVNYGATLRQLAAAAGLSEAQIAEYNDVPQPNGAFSGQLVALPQTRSTDVALTTLYAVGPAQSFWQIALKSNQPLYGLATANGMSNPHSAYLTQLVRATAAQNLTPVAGMPGFTEVSLRPATLEQGRTGGLQVVTPENTTLTVEFNGQPVNVYSTDGLTHAALIGIDRYTEPGLYPLRISYTSAAGQPVAYQQNVSITDGRYFIERIVIPADVAAVLNDETTEANEQAFVRSVMTGFTPEQYWDGPFNLPTPAVLTSAYGVTRNYNDGLLNRFHSGADFGGPAGTPIYAPADGIVIEIGGLDVRGLVTFIDHGRGVYTGYWHQTSILVQEGETVTKGQPIGTIGNTGLSSAAHLHWEMWVSGVPVDPLQWVRIAFP